VIVLDLRGNPGGLLNEAIDIAGLFIDQGPIVQVKDGHNEPVIMSNRNKGVVYRGPLIVLIDKFSASASEILAGAIQDYNRGVIVGSSPTFGKGTVQSYNVLPYNLGAVKITTHIFYQPGGKSNQLNGIPPHITIPDMSSIWDIGEGKTRFPLEWKPLPPAQFKPYAMINPAMISALKKQSMTRIKGNPEFIKLNEKIKRFKLQLDKKTISLKEESELNKQKEEEIKKIRSQSEEESSFDLSKDIFLKEAFSIAGDYIQILKR
jgi:carboxyl-terminal processing protease